MMHRNFILFHCSLLLVRLEDHWLTGQQKTGSKFNIIELGVERFSGKSEWCPLLGVVQCHLKTITQPEQKDSVASHMYITNVS